MVRAARWFGRSSFLGDFVLIRLLHYAILVHCVTNLTMFTNERRGVSPPVLQQDATLQQRT